MPVYYTNVHQTLRSTLPSGHYDMVIVTLAHQYAEMVHYLAKNIQRHVRGKFLWIVHYNGPDSINENDLPPFAWLVRETIYTRPSSRSISHAATKCFEFALKHTTFTNAMILSSGSAFFREFRVPTQETVGLLSHEPVFDVGKKLPHIEPIPIKHIGNCKEYLAKQGVEYGWQYQRGFDTDTDIHACMKKRKFTHLRGSQWSGQVFPAGVAIDLVEDLKTLVMKSDIEYCTEELYFSTYSYNYAIRNNINITYLETIINWGNCYIVPSVEYVKKLHDHVEGHAVCKLSDDVNDPIRLFLLEE